MQTLQQLRASAQLLKSTAFRLGDLLSKSLSTLAYEDYTAIHSAQEQQGRQSQHNKTHDVLIMHGLLGSGRNWRSFAKKLADAAASHTQQSFRMIMLDLRCHGKSSKLHLAPPHNMQTAAGDVLAFIKHELKHQPPLAILGHSMGGKVLLELLSQHQQATSEASRPAASTSLLPHQAWVLDSQPGLVAPGMDEKTGVAKVLKTIHGIKLPIPSRNWLTTYLKQQGFDQGMSAWLGSNVAPDAHGNLTWTFNSAGAGALYHSYMVNEYWGVLRAPPPGLAVHLVRGGKSDRWTPDMTQTLEDISTYHRHQSAQQQDDSLQNQSICTAQFCLHTLPKAGHWLHVDDPEGLLNCILPYLCQAAGRLADQQLNASTT